MMYLNKLRFLSLHSKVNNHLYIIKMSGHPNNQDNLDDVYSDLSDND